MLEKIRNLILAIIVSIILFMIGYNKKTNNEKELSNVQEVPIYVDDSILVDYYRKGKRQVKYYQFVNRNYIFYDDDLSFFGHNFIDSTHYLKDSVLVKLINIQNNDVKRIISMKMNNKQLIEENHIRGDLATSNNFLILLSVAVFAGGAIWCFRD
ncbi:MAG: hypothetical protein ACRC8Z_12165 [Empedobacter falsenii]